MSNEGEMATPEADKDVELVPHLRRRKLVECAQQKFEQGK